MTLDGFDPDIVKPRNRRHRHDTVAMDAPFTAPPQATPQPDSAPQQKTAPQHKPAEERQQRAQEQREISHVVDDSPWWMRFALTRFFFKDGTRLFMAVALILMSVFMLFAVMSHLKYGALDQSLVMNSTIAQMAQGPETVKNAGGAFGAWLSQVMLCDTLGLGSLPLIVYMWLLALGLLGLKKCRFWSVTFKTLLVSITISIVLGLIFLDSESVLKWGGEHGYYVNQWIISYATYLGAMLVSALLIVAVICVYLTEITSAWKRWRERVNRHRLQEQLRRERKRELENAVEQQETEESGQPAPVQEEIAIDAPTPAPAENTVETPVVTPVATEVQEMPISAEPHQEEAADDLGFNIDSPASEPITIQEIPAPQAPMEATAPEAPDLPASDEIAFSVGTQEIEEARKVAKKPYNPHDEFKGYMLPKIDLLEERACKIEVDMAEQEANKERIVQTLLNYNIKISKIEATVGPTITLYEIVPAEGVRISQIQRLEDDIALSLSALGIRIIAPIPGKGTVGIEVPNNDPQTVSMRSVIASAKYQESKMMLPMAMGATISNEIFMADLIKMPHLLVAGATGMGKSVGLNAILASLLYRKHPSELKLVLVDPKMVEFSLYAKIERYFLAKLPGEEEAIITDPNKVVPTLNSLCVEMDNRYALLKDASVRSLEDYNKKFTEGLISPEEGHKYLPYIVVVVDEFADLIMQSGKEVETPIARIAQKARAVGIHMILATQRPSTNVITGLIKANFPGRIAFRVIQMVDSRTILDCPGANQLIGKGDMLFSHNGNMTRVQCAFISTEEVEAIVDSIYRQVGPDLTYMLPDPPKGDEEGGKASANIGDRDAMFDEVARFIVGRQISSVSSLQRQFGIGYNRAGRLMDQMEAAGIVGRANGAKPRDILVDMMTLEHILEQN